MPSMGAMLQEDMDEQQKRIKDLEAENAFLRQEMRGLKKKLNAISPLFKVCCVTSYDAHVEMCDNKGEYWDFLKMKVETLNCSDEVLEVFEEVLDVFKKRGYE